jgi:hypothetical protein
MVGSLKMNTTLEYSTRVVQEGDRRCKKSTLNELAYLTPLRIPLMNPVIYYLGRGEALPKLPPPPPPPPIRLWTGLGVASLKSKHPFIHCLIPPPPPLAIHVGRERFCGRSGKAQSTYKPWTN